MGASSIVMITSKAKNQWFFLILRSLWKEMSYCQKTLISAFVKANSILIALFSWLYSSLCRMLKMKKTYIHKNSIDVIGTIVALKWCYIRSVIISCKEKEGKIWWHFLEGTQCDKYGKIVQYKYEPKHLQPYYLEDIIDPKGIGIHPYKII